MKYIKWNIHEQIKEMRSKILLQEQDRKAYYQASQDKMRLNSDIIHRLRIEVRNAEVALVKAEKQDEVTIAQAFRDRKELRLCLARGPVQSAKEVLANHVYFKMNQLNAMRFEVRKREEALQDLKRTLENLEKMTVADEELNEMQQIRQLENKTEKMETKINAVRNIGDTYLKILDYLQEGLQHMPVHLDELQYAVEIHRIDLTTMSQVAEDAIAVREAIRVDLNTIENKYTAEKKEREKTLSTNRKLVATEKQRIKEIADKQLLKRGMARKDRLAADSDTSTIALQLRGSENQSEKMKLTVKMDRLKNAVQCTKLSDIRERFKMVKETGEHMQQQITETEQKKVELKSVLWKLELEYAELKFHQGVGLKSNEEMKEEMEKQLERETERMTLIHTRLIKEQDLLHSVQEGIDSLYIKLYGVSMPGEQETMAAPEDSYEKLQACEVKLIYLLENTSSQQFHWNKEGRVKVREFLETSTAMEGRNLKISIEEVSEDSTVDAFDFANKEHDNAPTREDIKKMGKHLIDLKTVKLEKKKQQKVSKT